jgi:hypothetical protein
MAFINKVYVGVYLKLISILIYETFIENLKVIIMYTVSEPLLSSKICHSMILEIAIH